MAATFTCPQCLDSTPLDAGAKYCRRCGIAIADVGDDYSGFEITVENQPVKVNDRLTYGELCNLYRCTFLDSNREGVLKIARSPLANRHVQREVDVLHRLHAGDSENRFAPFLPWSVGKINYTHSAAEPARTGSALCYHQGIGGPDDLYSLEEVRAVYPAGIDVRDMAWIWRRMLSILGFVHQMKLVHSSVTPDHVLIEPREHKLVLIGWCGAIDFGRAPVLQPAKWRGWSKWDSGASATTDLSAAAKTAQFLLSSPVEPAIARHLERAADSKTGAWRLLDDFDQMIEALWGPRQFRPFVMPARGR